MGFSFKCHECGKFMSNDGICYTPYGNSTMIEPPDEEYICKKCWNGMSNERKELIYRISWHKPMLICDAY